jgi:hypothetical protein
MAARVDRPSKTSTRFVFAVPPLYLGSAADQIRRALQGRAFPQSHFGQIVPNWNLQRGKEPAGLPAHGAGAWGCGRAVEVTRAGGFDGNIPVEGQ